MHIAVFDTNVLLSGIGWRGKPFECLELARAKKCRGVTCAEILTELAAKLETKLNFAPEEIAATLADLLSFLELGTIAGELKFVEADPDDDKVLECAVNARATHVVTGDRRHLLPIGTFQGIEIVTAAQFADRCRDQHAST